jgi:hypothetical protein
MNPFSGKTAEQIRETWQSRLLREADTFQGRVLVGVFAKEYASALVLLLRADTSFVDIERPFFSGYAMITPSGRLVCDVTYEDESVRKYEVYKTEQEFINDMRKLADKVKLSDEDRTSFFDVLKRWVVADMRTERRPRLAS